MGHPAHTAQLAAKASAAQGSYERHRPETTVLYQVVEQHWPDFLERAEDAGGLPRFVVREIEAYLRCGMLQHGCLHLVCEDCGFDRLVAFSCKRRGFCPSCLGRRMSDAAVHLVERVLPEVPVRHWVCSLPWRLRTLCGYDRRLCAAVMRAFIRELHRSLRFRAKREFGLPSVKASFPGTVTVMQRFDSALRLNVHWHTLALDGVYVRKRSGALIFLALPEPSYEEVLEVAERTANRVAKVLKELPRSLDGADDEQGQGDLAVDPESALGACYGAASQGLELFGERAGKRALRLVDPALAQATEPVAEVGGINVHAKRSVDGRDRAQLERMCRYLVRPPIAQDRLERLPDGRVRYTMKRVWRDGTHAIVLSPETLMARLCAMVPPPRMHLIRFHGVLASHASRRREVVPAAPKPLATPEQLSLFGEPNDTEPSDTEPSRKSWSWMVRHVFLEDVSRCPKCSGNMRWVEVATTPEAIARLVAAHDRASPEPPSTRRPAMRAPPSPQMVLPFVA